jgi:hypothetical protein
MAAFYFGCFFIEKILTNIGLMEGIAVLKCMAKNNWALSE